jgi:Homeodomain-like domain
VVLTFFGVFRASDSMVRAYSSDLRWRMVYLHEDGHPTYDIAESLYVNVRTVRRVLRLYRKWGCVENPFKGKNGQSKLFSEAELEVCRMKGFFITIMGQLFTIVFNNNKDTSKVGCRQG